MCNAVKKFHNIHKGETCVVIGNGPSLDITPLEQLNYVTFGSNMIYRKPFTPMYYSIVDEEMLKACLPLPEYFQPVKFLRAEANEPDNNPIYPIVAAGFSLDPSNFVVMGGTVTFVLLQLAFYMGFETVLLVGVDHSYPNASRFTGHKFLAGLKDPDHFKPSDGRPYFETGKQYNAPEDTTKAYEIAKDLYDKVGRRIVNLTPNSKLNVFPRDTFANWTRNA